MKPFWNPFRKKSAQDLKIESCRAESQKSMAEAKLFGDLSEDWYGFFCSDFGIRFPFSSVKLPESEGGYNRVIFDPGSKILSYEKLLFVSRRVYPVEIEFSDSLNGVTEREWPGFVEPHAVRCEDLSDIGKRCLRRETTAKKIRAENIQTLALRHMMLYHLKWYRENSGHLDQINKTRCSWSLAGKDQVATTQFRKDTLVIGVNFLSDTFPMSQDRIAKY